MIDIDVDSTWAKELEQKILVELGFDFNLVKVEFVQVVEPQVRFAKFFFWGRGAGEHYVEVSVPTNPEALQLERLKGKPKDLQASAVMKRLFDLVFRAVDKETAKNEQF